MSKPKRTLVLSSINGALKCLLIAIKKCNFDIENDKLIFLGDYGDGFSDSPHVIQYLLYLQRKCAHKPIFIRGNEDRWLECFLDKGECNRNWRRAGRPKEAIKAYMGLPNLNPDNHIKFYKDLKNYHVDSNDRLFVHAGFTHQNGVEYEIFPSDLYWDDQMFDIANKLDNLYRKDTHVIPRSTIYNEVFISNKPTLHYKYGMDTRGIDKDMMLIGKRITTPMQRCNVWNINTGVKYGGTITIMDIDSKQYWQSEKSTIIYKNNKELI